MLAVLTGAALCCFVLLILLWAGGRALMDAGVSCVVPCSRVPDTCDACAPSCLADRHARAP